MTLYNHNTVVQKLFELVVIDRLTLFYSNLLMQLNQLVITNYRAAITVKQLSYIITFYHNTILLLKLC